MTFLFVSSIATASNGEVRVRTRLDIVIRADGRRCSRPIQIQVQVQRSRSCGCGWMRRSAPCSPPSCYRLKSKHMYLRRKRKGRQLLWIGLSGVIFRSVSKSPVPIVPFRMTSARKKTQKNTLLLNFQLAKMPQITGVPSFTGYRFQRLIETAIW